MSKQKSVTAKNFAGDATPREDFIPEAGADFVITPYIEDLTNRALAYLRVGYAVHLSGPAGTGKSTLAMHIASQLGQPCTLLHGDDEFNRLTAEVSQTKMELETAEQERQSLQRVRIEKAEADRQASELSRQIEEAHTMYERLQREVDEQNRASEKLQHQIEQDRLQAEQEADQMRSLHEQREALSSEAESLVLAKLKMDIASVRASMVDAEPEKPVLAKAEPQPRMMPPSETARASSAPDPWSEVLGEIRQVKSELDSALMDRPQTSDRIGL